MIFNPIFIGQNKTKHSDPFIQAFHTTLSEHKDGDNTKNCLKSVRMVVTTPFYFHNMICFQVKQDIKQDIKVEMCEKWVFHT